MASGTQSNSMAPADIWKRIIQNVGGAPGQSAGLGELESEFATALLSFTTPSAVDVNLGPSLTTAQSYDRRLTNLVAGTALSGTKNMTSIYLPANTVVNNLNFVSGTTAAITPTHSWAALYNSARVLLAISADGLTTAIGASTAIVFPIATIAAGASTTFTTTYSGLYYVGIVVVAGTQPTWAGYTGTATENGLVPILSGTSDTGLTVPETFPTTAGAITATNQSLYAYTT